MNNPRAVWLLGYILANVIGYIIMANTGRLIGDVEGVPVYSQTVLFFSALITILFYYLLLGPCFGFITKIKTRKNSHKIVDGDLALRIGLLLIVLQLSFFYFNVTQGVNIAGSGDLKAQGLMSLFWIFLPVDAFFIIFYSIYRDSRLFAPNLMIWFASNLYRGWAGVFLFILFFEFCRLYRGRKIGYKKSLLIFFIVLCIYPFINIIKWAARGFAGADFDFLLLLDAVTNSIGLDDYLSFVFDGLSHLVGRLQTTSMLVEVVRLQPILSDAFEKSQFIPFWKDGIVGIAYDTLVHGSKGTPLSVIFPLYADLGSIDALGKWNTNTGFASWFLIAPILSPVYLMYVLGLCLLSSFLMKKLSSSQSSMDGLWLAWLIYLLPPWFGAFVGYIQALFIFYVVTLILRKIPHIRLAIFQFRA
jgi:hypothetical protein